MSTPIRPVYDGYFADPFVLRHEGQYWAYGTGHGPQPDGRQFPVLRSDDLVHWKYVGGALPPLVGGGEPFTAYWAPETAYRDGRFYLYYSAATGGRDETHRLRVAVADRPQGPFADAGPVKMPSNFADVFAIDAHPFRDPATGRWFLFFACDFFNDRVGTGTAGFELADDMKSAQGEAVPILRAHSDWHIYERNRPLYGKTWDAWHTVEGPFVWPHDGYYYCFYSGGNWQTHLYGVGYGVAENVLGPYRDESNLHGASVLAGIENKIYGPGHNSVVKGPDGVTDYIVYHAWDAQRTARRMFVSRLEWRAGGNGDAPPRPRAVIE